MTLSVWRWATDISDISDVSYNKPRGSVGIGAWRQHLPSVIDFANGELVEAKV